VSVRFSDRGEKEIELKRNRERAKKNNNTHFEE